ncbi:MAG: glycosyltransferase [Cellulosilyticaceae bacterium]
MKIMMVSCSALPYHNSGVAQVVHHVSRELQDKGHEVGIFTLSYAQTHKKGTLYKEKYEGYEVCAVRLDYIPQDQTNDFSIQTYKQPKTASYFKEYLEVFNPDIVHFHSVQGMGVEMLEVAKAYGTKVVVTMHDWWWICPRSFMVDGDYVPCGLQISNDEQCLQCVQKTCPTIESQYIKKRREYLHDALMKNVDRIYAVSNRLKQDLEKHLPSGCTIQVNANGVEKPVETQHTASDVLRFGFLGGVHPIKGYKVLHKATKQVKRSDWELHIYGVPQVDTKGLRKVYQYLRKQGASGLWKKVTQILKDKQQATKGVSGKIVLHKAFESGEKDAVFAQIDVLICASLMQESSSLVVREALIRGIPVISTPSGGPMEVIRHGETGEILADYEAHTLAEAMERVLEPAYYKALCEQLKKQPYSYTYEEQSEALLQAYEQLEVTL